MPNSMTAFSRSEAGYDWGDVVWELRSVNHRYLDIALKLPEDLRLLEPQCRERISGRLRRGRVDGQLRLRIAGGADGAMVLDDDVVGRLLDLADRVTAERPTLRPLGAIDVLSWPGAIRTQEIDAERVHAAVLRLLDTVLADLGEARAREGARLGEFVGERLVAARRILEGIKAELPDISAGLRDRLHARVAEIRESVDPARLEQELVLQLTKADVHEELDRLDAHLAEVADLLESAGPTGRRLEFLVQELHREANTLGSKAADTRITNASVELKVLIDQIREQVLNIE